MRKIAMLLSAAAIWLPADAKLYRSAISFEDGCETIASNPARGVAGGGWVVFKPEGLPKWNAAPGYHSSLWELSRFSGGREQNGKRPRPERVGEADAPLTDAMKADVRRFLSDARAKGGSLIVRIGYTWSDQAGCEPADFDIVLGHVKELSRIMADFDDVVVGVEAGVAGPWAEMHSSDYCKAEYMNRVLETYCANLSSNISVLVRSPGYISKLAGTNTVGVLSLLPFRDEPLKRIGMYNDGYLGTWWDYGTWAGDFTRERGCEMLKTFADHPYGGELAYVNRDWIEKNKKLFELENWNLVRDWYETHLNYLRNIGDGGHTLTKFLAEEMVFDSSKYKFDGMPDLHEYDGKDMRKFCLDHMGYRFVARNVLLQQKLSPGKRAKMFVDVENTGFGKLLLPASSALVFTRGGKSAIVPTAFSCNLGGGERRRFKFDFTVPKSLAGEGPISVSLRVWCPLKGESNSGLPVRPVRFANAGCWREDLKSNILFQDAGKP